MRREALSVPAQATALEHGFEAETGSVEAAEARVPPQLVQPVRRPYKKLRPGPGRSPAKVAEHQRARCQSAMLEIVADRGHGAVTVRELAQIAGVSSRAFYENYSGKDECFLRTHDLVVRSVVHRLDEARVGEADPRKRLRASISAFLDALQREPRAGRFLLIDAYAAGSLAVEQVRRAEQRFETRIAECLESTPMEPSLPSQLTRGMVVGLICVARSRLLADRGASLTHLTDDLTDWATDVYRSFEGKTRRSESTDARSHDASEYVALLSRGESRQWPVEGDRGLILAALARLAASESYDELTVAKVRESAGVSNKKFTTHFKGLADCFQEAIELYAGRAMPRLSAQYDSDEAITQDLAEPIRSLCESVGHDPTFSTLCFTDVFAPGLGGVHSANRVIGQVASILCKGQQVRSASCLVTEAAAGAVWGAIREELYAKGRCGVPQIAPTIKAFAPEPTQMENLVTQNLTDPDPPAMLVPRAEKTNSALTVTTK